MDKFEQIQHDTYIIQLMQWTKWQTKFWSVGYLTMWATWSLPFMFVSASLLKITNYCSTIALPNIFIVVTTDWYTVCLWVLYNVHEASLVLNDYNRMSVTLGTQDSRLMLKEKLKTPYKPGSILLGWHQHWIISVGDDAKIELICTPALQAWCFQPPTNQVDNYLLSRKCLTRKIRDFPVTLNIPVTLTVTAPMSYCELGKTDTISQYVLSRYNHAIHQW